MGEQKNLFLAIGLSIAIIVIFQLMFPQEKTSNIEKNNKDYSTPNDIDSDTGNQIVIKEDSDLIDKIQSKDKIINQGNRVNINSPQIRGSINLKGAVLDDIVLSQYYKTTDNLKNINLFSPDGTEHPYFIEFEWILNNQVNKTELPNKDTQWQSSNNELTPNKPISLFWTNEDNITFTINFSIDENFMFNVIQEIDNQSNKPLNIYPRQTIKRIYKPKTKDFFISHEGLISNINDRLYEKKYKTLKKECDANNYKIIDGKKIPLQELECNLSSNDAWLGFTDKYWMSALIPNNNKSVNTSFKFYNQGRDIYLVRYYDNIDNIVNPNSKHTFGGKIFTGAKSLKVLNQYSSQYNIKRFTDAIDWGWFSFLTKPISYSINWFNGYVKNFGLAIIAFTILMRLILFPLAHTSFKSMAKMKKLQPDMQRLKETYPDDRQKMQQELMALYKKEGANPVAGCLPIIVQIPIFFSLYKVLFNTIEMYQAPFYGWIIDLSAPDPLGILTIFGLLAWEVPSQLSLINIGILPIFMGFTMWLQQKLNPAPTDPTQAKIFAFLPFVFTFILAGFAAGLVLYWSVNNILSIAQQWFIQRKILAKNV